MAPEATVQKQLQRVGELVGRLESSSDPNVKAVARELLEALLAFHGTALEKILELVAGSGEAGENIIRKCGSDELVSSLLLLYGLHPHDLHARVTRALEKSANFLAAQGASAEILSIDAVGAVTVRLHMKSSGCGSSAGAVKSSLETAILNAAPDATSIVVEAIDTGISQSGFVSLEQLTSGRTTAHGPIAQGSAD
jgi:Fe-S cluster biogenesis protein NfuA